MIEYWKSRLSDSSKRQYELLLNAIRQQNGTVDLSVTQNIVNEVQKIYQNILFDHPELYYASPQIAATMSIRFFTVNLSYLYDVKQRQEIDQSFNNLRNDLRKVLNKSDIEKVYAAVFLLMKNSRYEVNNLYNQNAAAAIHYHTSQCSGFASAFKFAMDFLGIWCIVVSGSISNHAQSGPHAWNIVKLNESYYHIDITPFSNVNLTEANQLSRYRFFESDEQKKQQGYIWNSSDTPVCSEMEMSASPKSNDYVKNVQPTSSENTAGSENGLPTFTRLFDVQSKIRECLKNRITYYEFVLKIPMYSNEKLMRMVMNDISEQGRMLSVSFEVEVGCMNNKIYIKFNYKN